MRLIAIKLWTVALIVALGVVLSGCVPGRAGIAHNYNSPYGSGTVYYEGGPAHHKPPKPPKQKKPKKPKKKKNDKHHHD